MENNNKILQDLSPNTVKKRLDLKERVAETESRPIFFEGAVDLKEARKVCCLGREKAPKSRKKSLKKSPGKETRHLRDLVSLKKPDPTMENHFSSQSDEPESPRTINLKEAIYLSGGGIIILVLIAVISLFHMATQPKNDITATALSGFEELVEAGKVAREFDLFQAGKYLRSARQDFDAASEKIWFLNRVFTNENAGSELFTAAPTVLAIGEDLTTAGEYFVKAVDGIDKLYSQFTEGNKIAAATFSRPSITDQLKQRFQAIKKAHLSVAAAYGKIQQIDESVIPADFRDYFLSARDKISGLNDILTGTDRYLPVALKLLGDEHPIGYLILLQNNSEARPTGGFIGSYILLDINDGYIERLDFHDVYDADGQLHEDIPAPEEIAQLTDNWRLRDSNYSPDFRISAAKAAWFLEKEKGPGVDAVIAINLSILKKILAITGPIQLGAVNSGIVDPQLGSTAGPSPSMQGSATPPATGGSTLAPLATNPTLAPPTSGPNQLKPLPQALTSDNADEILTYLVESKWSGETSPKKMFTDLIPKVQKELFTAEKLPQLMSLVVGEMKKKEILAWSKDQEIQAFFEEMGIAGNIAPAMPDEDYLSVSVISIGGNKSDRYISQKIHHISYLKEDGSVINEITLSRENTFSPGEERRLNEVVKGFGFEEIPQRVMHILGKGENKSAIKIYVPTGAELLDVRGLPKEDVAVRQNAELDKTYFYFFMNVYPENVNTVTLKYKLPFKLDFWPSAKYRLTVQKQPGFISPSDITKQIVPDGPFTRYRLYPEGWEDANGLVTYRTNLLYDRVFAGIWGE